MARGAGRPTGAPSRARGLPGDERVSLSARMRAAAPDSARRSPGEWGGAGWSGPSSQTQAERDPPLPGHFPLRVSRADPAVRTGSHGGHGRGAFLPPPESLPGRWERLPGRGLPCPCLCLPVSPPLFPGSLAPPPGLGTLSWRTRDAFRFLSRPRQEELQEKQGAERGSGASCFNGTFPGFVRCLRLRAALSPSPALSPAPALTPSGLPGGDQAQRRQLGWCPRYTGNHPGKKQIMRRNEEPP